MAKNLKLISAKYIGGYNDTNIFEAVINYYGELIHIDIEEYHHNMQIPNRTWKVVTDKNISYREKEGILKAIIQDKPRYIADVKPQIYNKEINVIEKVKTLKGWEESKCELTDYLKIGDKVNKEFLDYFIDMLPPKTLTGEMVQIGEAYSTDKNGKDTYITFAKDVPFGDWHYKGACLLGSMINEEREFEEFDMSHFEENVDVKKILLEIKENVDHIHDFLKKPNNKDFKDLDEIKKLEKYGLIIQWKEIKDIQQTLDEMLEVLWEALEDVPFDERNGELYLADDYLDFDVGMKREEIWHWFDDRYSKGIYNLLYEQKKERNSEEESYEFE